MPVGVNLKTFVYSSTGEGTTKHEKHYRNLSCMWSCVQAPAVNNPCGAIDTAFYLMFLRAGPWMCVFWSTPDTCLPAIWTSLANASASTYRRLKTDSTWLENLGRGHQESQVCVESPNALWISVFIGNSLQFLWGLAPESSSVLSDSKYHQQMWAMQLQKWEKLPRVCVGQG